MGSTDSFRCDACGQGSPRWFGRCPDCGTWGSATTVAPGASGSPAISALSIVEERVARVPSGICEVDRVLGGGFVPGSVTLLAGDPGVGKSTLVLQITDGLAAAGRATLLVTAEESLDQVALRARRLDVDGSRLAAVATSSLAEVLIAAKESKADVVFVDSIQTVEDASLNQRAGSVTQVRECAIELTRFAKTSGCAVVLIGHVTKDGDVAGPKSLEHLVDAVLGMEGERSETLRVLRAHKNRFGSCEETGVFAMGEKGLDEVSDPSKLFLSDRLVGVPGSIVFPSIEGTRPILVEAQALVTETDLPHPRRVAIGSDARRLAMLMGILRKHAGLPLDRHDVYVAMAGGLTVKEPAADLALCMSIGSALLDVPVPEGTVAFGEVGLAGEVRRVPSIERRLEEAARLGFARAIVSRHVERGPRDLELVRVKDVATATEYLRSKPRLAAVRERPNERRVTI
jgi:DNA repair protein RadA/Sms